MGRLENTFAACKASGRKALVTFIMAGDPAEEISAHVLAQLPAAGADVIEIGMPFTDPAADGISIQKAGLRALAAGMTLQKTLKMVQNFRTTNAHTPIVLMGYVNPVFSYGFEKFIIDAVQAGVDGLIIVDLPPEEDQDLRALSAKAGIDMIRLVTPTTKDMRLEKVLSGASGFLYYVSITGVTGAAKANLNALAPHITEIKELTNLPVAIGFGIRTPNDAQEMSRIGDAVVVGSAIVEKMSEIKGVDASCDPVLDLVKSLSAVLGSRPVS